MELDKQELIRFFIESEFDYPNTFQSVFDWAYISLEQNIDDKNHQIAYLAGLPPTDANEVLKCLEKIIGRAVTAEEKEEWGGKFVCKLWSRFENHQLSEQELRDQLFKLYEYLEEPDWLAFVSAIDLDAPQGEFLTNVEKKLSLIISLWTQFPSYSVFNEKFKKIQKNLQKNISCHYVFKNLFEVSYFPYVWPEDFIDSTNKNEIFKRGVRTSDSLVLVSVNIGISESIHTLYAKDWQKAEKELPNYQLIDKGQTVLCGINARWCSYFYTEKKMKIKGLKYFFANALNSFTITFEADTKKYPGNQAYFDAFIKSFKLI